MLNDYKKSHAIVFLLNLGDKIENHQYFIG
jgi:hypothetical protein